MILTLLALCFLKVYIINANIFFRYCEMFVLMELYALAGFLVSSLAHINGHYCVMFFVTDERGKWETFQDHSVSLYDMA